MFTVTGTAGEFLSAGCPASPAVIIVICGGINTERVTAGLIKPALDIPVATVIFIIRCIDAFAIIADIRPAACLAACTAIVVV